MADRWIEILETTPSGRTMFVCQGCGRKTDAPTKECSNPALYNVGDGEKIYIPCSAWPTKPMDWVRIQKRMSPDNIVFSGTLTFDDGTTVEVTAPIHEALAKDLVVVNTELKMRETREEKAVDQLAAKSRVEELERTQKELERIRRMQAIQQQGTPNRMGVADRIKQQSNNYSLDRRDAELGEKMREERAATPSAGAINEAGGGLGLAGLGAGFTGIPSGLVDDRSDLDG